MEKQFTLDWDSPKEITRLISVLHQRKRDLEGYTGKKQRAQETLDLMLKIWDSETPLEGKSLSSEDKFYVYAHYSVSHRQEFPSKRSGLEMFCHRIGLPAVPFYIGKGCGNRCSNKERNKGHQLVRSFSEDSGSETVSQILFQDLTEIQSLVLEGKLIDIIGQRVIKTGPLTNLDEGYKPRIRRRGYSTQLGKLHPIYYKMTLGDKSSQMT